MSEYKVYFYRKSNNKKVPVKEYLEKLSKGEQAKIASYIQLLRENEGYLEEPYSRHLKDGIRELRPKNDRVLYVLVKGKKIILLHAFRKTTQKTPSGEIEKAEEYFQDYKTHPKFTLESYK
ncbi:MAG: type II toxin-antitoxin system RelE/ParE family toxin [Candidatus Spechtbacterales bacterium]